MKAMSLKNIVRILPSMSLDSILVSSVVSVSGPYTELHERVYLHRSCFGYINALFTNKLWKFVVRF